jgi:4-hydroxy-tetrahydrodipicolinate reductase
MALKIAIIGYGKMGQMIEVIAQERKHSIIARLDKGWDIDQLKGADVAIEFSEPNSAVENISKALTGWYRHINSIKDLTVNAGLVYASNFSLGVNVFFEVNKKLSKLLANREEYKASIKETHHTNKKDIPSGTAITLAEQLIENTSITDWSLKDENQKIKIESKREKEVCGDHSVTYQSEIDKITISHSAFNRKGFALGAIIAAEKIQGKTGIHPFNSLLF